MSCTREEKCKDAVRVLEALGDLEVLCVGSLAVEAVDSNMKWGTQHADELDLLIHHTDLEKFMLAMEHEGFKLAEYDEGKWHMKNSSKVRKSIEEMPVSPEYSYAPEACIGKPEEPHLWITFHTTTRHGRLILVDLAEWFGGKKEYRGDFGLEVYRPPLWAVLLWKAAEVACAASEQSIARHDVDRLRAVAQAQGSTWSDALAKAKAYEAEYRQRLSRPAAVKQFQAYQKRMKLSDADMEIAEKQYDALYELSHAVRPVKGTVPDNILAELETIATNRPRKLWAYEGSEGGHPVAPPDDRGRLGIAKDDFGIEEQLRHYEASPSTTFGELVTLGYIERVLIPSGSGPPAAPPHGPWHKFKEDDTDSLFS